MSKTWNYCKVNTLYNKCTNSAQWSSLKVSKSVGSDTEFEVEIKKKKSVSFFVGVLSALAELKLA